VEKAGRSSVEVGKKVVKTLLPFLGLRHRHHLRVGQEPVQDALRGVGGGRGVQCVAKIKADVRVEREPYCGVGLFFKGRGGEGEGEGEGRGGLCLGESANSAAHTTVKAGALPQGVKSFDDNPGSELLLACCIVLLPCSCC